MSDDFMKSMYGNETYRSSSKSEKTTKTNNAAAISNAKEKLSSRVIGGLKAQNAHFQTLEIDGKFITVPKLEYVEQLEKQLKETRDLLKSSENKIKSLMKSNASMMNKFREIDRELANKVDLR